MRLPVEVIRSGSTSINKVGETRNLSSTGVLFSSEARVGIGDPIEYVITLPSSRPGDGEVRLRCMGKIVRHDERSAAAATLAAATLERYEFIRE